jgi:fatty acid desaturase
MTIPGRLNLLILAASLSGISACLWLASHTPWPVALVAAVIFALLNNTNYALMHEAVHRHFHPVGWVNEAAGRVLAGVFPTAFALQRIFHLTHHANNRSEAERFDYYAPNENRLIKVLQWYSILTGLYWVALPAFAIVYFLTADLIGWRHLLSRRGEWFARQTSAREFLDSLGRVPIWRARVDIAIGIAVQLGLIWVLDVSLAGWFLCYAAFAFTWSSLQYTDHAFSPLNAEEGAWNLKVSPLVRRVFLNYHFHLAHHRDPSLPWTDLPGSVQAGDPSPSFWAIYLQMWRGPRPLPGADGSK